MQSSQTVLQSSKNLAKSLEKNTQKGAHPLAKMQYIRLSFLKFTERLKEHTFGRTSINDFFRNLNFLLN